MRISNALWAELVVEDCRYSLVEVYRLRQSLPGDGCPFYRGFLDCRGAPRLGLDREREIANSADRRASSEDFPYGLLPKAG
jgi:hypothetical protein